MTREHEPGIPMSTVRRASASDSEGMAEIYGPYCERTHLCFETRAPSAAEFTERIAKVTARLPWLVAGPEGRVDGYAYASQHRERAAYRWSVDVAVYVARHARRQGVARRLYRSLFGLLAAQGYYRAHAGISLPNPESQALHESMGFEHVGVYRNVGFKLGAWRDVGWWQLALRPIHPEQPAEPVPWMDLEGTPAWNEAFGPDASPARDQRAAARAG